VYRKGVFLQKLSNSEDELALNKMIKISEQIKQGKLKIFSEEEVKKKYNLK